jgi:hypothetical protein
VGLKESHISQCEFVQKDLVGLSMERTHEQIVCISMARKTRECNHGKGNEWFYSKGRTEMEKEGKNELKGIKECMRFREK